MRVSKRIRELSVKGGICLFAFLLLSASAAADYVEDTRPFTKKMVDRLKKERRECGALVIGVGPITLEFGSEIFSRSQKRVLKEIATNIGAITARDADDIRRGIIANLTSYSDDGVDVIDRRRLDVALEEIGIFRADDLRAFADPDKIARLGRMVNAKYLTFPQVEVRFIIGDWVEAGDTKIPRSCDIEVAYESEVMCVETAVTVAYIQHMETYHYAPECGVRVENVYPDNSRNAWRVRLDVTCKQIYGRSLILGVTAISTSSEHITTRTRTVGPITSIEYDWDEIEIIIPYEDFRKQSNKQLQDIQYRQSRTNLNIRDPRRNYAQVNFTFEGFVGEKSYGGNIDKLDTHHSSAIYNVSF